MVDLRAKIHRNAFWPLGFHDVPILGENLVLASQDILFGEVLPEIDRDTKPDDAVYFVDRLRRQERTEPVAGTAEMTFIWIGYLYRLGKRSDQPTIDAIEIGRIDRPLPMIAVGLVHPDPARTDAVLILEDLVVIDLVWFVFDAVEPAVNEREVRRVDEIFDGTESIRLEHVGPSVEFTETRILPFGEVGNAVFRSAKRRPHHAVALLGRMREGPRFQRWWLIRRGGNKDALCGALVSPTMIGTFDSIVGDPAFGKTCAAMDA